MDDKDPNCVEYAAGGNRFPYLSGSERKELKNNNWSTKLIYTKKNNEPHEMRHIAVRNLEDCKAFSNESFDKLFTELATLEQNHGPGKVIYHCNGGLGRAPTFLTARTLWQAKKRAKELGMKVSWDEDNQETLVSGNTLNLASLYKRILVLGTYARSTFVQSEEQFKALRAYGQHLAR